MTFRHLYAYAQTVPPRIHRNALRDKVLQLSGINRIAVVRARLDETQCRGMYFSLQHTEHQFIRQHGCRVIVLARGIEKEWERLVFVKELMHLFDEPKHAADSGDKLETLLTQLAGGASPDLSDATISEINCLWMALSVLCPDERRAAYRQQRGRQEIDHFTIATQLRIPEIYVTHLLSPEFDKNIRRICGEDIF